MEHGRSPPDLLRRVLRVHPVTQCQKEKSALPLGAERSSPKPVAVVDDLDPVLQFCAIKFFEMFPEPRRREQETMRVGVYSLFHQPNLEIGCHQFVHGANGLVALRADLLTRKHPLRTAERNPQILAQHFDAKPGVLQPLAYILYDRIVYREPIDPNPVPVEEGRSPAVNWLRLPIAPGIRRHLLSLAGHIVCKGIASLFILFDFVCPPHTRLAGPQDRPVQCKRLGNQPIKVRSLRHNELGVLLSGGRIVYPGWKPEQQLRAGNKDCWAEARRVHKDYSRPRDHGLEQPDPQRMASARAVLTEPGQVFEFKVDVSNFIQALDMRHLRKKVDRMSWVLQAPMSFTQMGVGRNNRWREAGDEVIPVERLPRLLKAVQFQIHG